MLEQTDAGLMYYKEVQILLQIWTLIFYHLKGAIATFWALSQPRFPYFCCLSNEYQQIGGLSG